MTSTYTIITPKSTITVANLELFSAIDTARHYSEQFPGERTCLYDMGGKLIMVFDEPEKNRFVK